MPDFFINIDNMKLKLFLIYFIGLFFIDPVVYAEVAPGYQHTQKVTCGTSGVLCGPQQDACLQGTYCKQAECMQCEDPWLLSDPASVGQDSCYQVCGIKDIDYGEWEPDYNIACHGNYCSYEEYYFVCDNEDDECNGYHAEGEGKDKKCVPNMQEWSDETTDESGWKQWTKDTGWVKYTTGCGSNSHLEPTKIDSNNNKEYGFLCNDIVYGKCVSNTRNCSDYFGTTCENNGKSGTVGGTIEWETDIIPEGPGWGDVHEYVGGVVDFSNCYCEIEGVETGAGTATQHCFWGDSGPWGEDVEWSGGCETESFTKCAAGNCDIDNSGICNTAPAGYYGDGTMMACQPCPIGATSAVGATGIDRCFMQTGNTEFCDSVGCFKLPSNVPY